MLNNEAIANIEKLKSVATDAFGNNVDFGEIEVIKSPYPAFEMQLTLYKKYNVLLEYETSTFALKLFTGEKFEYLDKVTKDKIFYGFDSMIPENIAHNFDILDKALRMMN